MTIVQIGEGLQGPRQVGWQLGDKVGREITEQQRRHKSLLLFGVRWVAHVHGDELREIGHVGRHLVEIGIAERDVLPVGREGDRTENGSKIQPREEEDGDRGRRVEETRIQKHFSDTLLGRGAKAPEHSSVAVLSSVPPLH